MSPIAEKTKKVERNELKVNEVPFPPSKIDQAEKERLKMLDLQKMNAIIANLNVQAENEKKRRPKPPREEFLWVLFPFSN